MIGGPQTANTASADSPSDAWRLPGSSGNSNLRVEHLTRNFGGLMAVNDVTLDIQAGERRAIIGPNGAGKTTLFNLISGEIPPAGGRILLGGMDITPLSIHHRARLGLGRTFQRNSLFSGLSVRENVRLALQSTMGLTHQALRPIDRFPRLNAETESLLERSGLSEYADRAAGTVSYGVQRQLEVALALATHPNVLLLDEPTAGMSPAETAAMVNLISETPRHITVVIIEHDMDVVFGLAERVTVLHYGEVIAEGTPVEIRTNPRVMEVYLGTTGGASV